MSRPQFEVADVIRRYGENFLDAYGDSVSFQQRHILNSLAVCRTEALGGHVLECDNQCGHQEISCNSCRNRHCPKCQASLSADWVHARREDLLDVLYFHLVFTLPGELVGLAIQNKAVLYDLLFQASSQTLQQIAADPKHLGAQIGFLGVLHTWGQNLMHHPHVHYVVPGGGISPDGSRWIASRSKFFLPVRVLSRLFRGKFLDGLRRAFDQKKLSFHGQLIDLEQPDAFTALLRNARRHDWVVYAKPPFGGPDQVLKYLARYTHRVAISNRRILSIDDGKVSFSWKDYANGNARREMALDASEFIRRFLLHTLPKGFVRIRHYGFLANRVRKAKLELCRQLIGTPPPDSGSDHDKANPDSQDARPDQCPACDEGRLIRTRNIDPSPTRTTNFSKNRPRAPDTS